MLVARLSKVSMWGRNPDDHRNDFYTGIGPLCDQLVLEKIIVSGCFRYSPRRCWGVC